MAFSRSSFPERLLLAFDQMFSFHYREIFRCIFTSIRRTKKVLNFLPNGQGEPNRLAYAPSSKICQCGRVISRRDPLD